MKVLNDEYVTNARLGMRVIFSRNKQAAGKCYLCADIRQKLVISETRKQGQLDHGDHIADMRGQREAYTKQKLLAAGGEIHALAWDSQGGHATVVPNNDQGLLPANQGAFNLKLTNCKLHGTAVPDHVVVSPDCNAKTADQQLTIFLGLIVALAPSQELPFAESKSIKKFPDELHIHMDG
jgi:hypothetical protein